MASTDLEVILTQYNRESADDALVAALLASVSWSSSSARVSSRLQRQREEANNDEHDEWEGVENANAEDMGDNCGEDEGEGGEEVQVQEGKAGEELDDREDGSDNDDLPPRRPPLRQIQRDGLRAGPTLLVATTPGAGAKKVTPTSTTSRPSSSQTQPKSTRPRERRLAHCLACTYLNDVTERYPAFCSECANPWGVRSAQPSTTESPGPATTATTKAAPTPTIWPGAAAFDAKPIGALIMAPHSRNPGLAPLDERIIRHAREGKQHYTLADLLQLRAEDRSTTSSAVLSESAILFDPREGTLTSAVGAAATSARSAAARRRTITGFAEIVEVIVFSLIGTIYVDRPDIGQQLFGLLIVAQDLTRSWGWTFALDYVERVRSKFHTSVGGPKGRHCLRVDSTYDMGMRDVDVLFDIQLHHISNAVGKENSNVPTA